MSKAKASILALASLALASSSAKALSLTEQQEESLVKSIIPATKVEKVERAEADGFYKAFLGNGQLLYINPFKRLIFVGELYTAGGQNLTGSDREAWAYELHNQQLSSITREELVASAVKVDFGKGSREYEFVIFTDPECPYCAKVEDHFSKNDASIYVNLFPLSFHKNAEKWSLEALSSKDFKKAMESIKKSGKDLGVEITPKAKKQLQEMVDLGNRLNVNGTPKIFVVSKSQQKVVGIIDGANLAKIDDFLKKDKPNEVN